MAQYWEWPHCVRFGRRPRRRTSLDSIKSKEQHLFRLNARLSRHRWARPQPAESAQTGTVLLSVHFAKQNATPLNRSLRCCGLHAFQGTLRPVWAVPSNQEDAASFLTESANISAEDHVAATSRKRLLVTDGAKIASDSCGLPPWTDPGRGPQECGRPVRKQEREHAPQKEMPCQVN